jgi:hypothetical protein
VQYNGKQMSLELSSALGNFLSNVKLHNPLCPTPPPASSFHVEMRAATAMYMMIIAFCGDDKRSPINAESSARPLHQPPFKKHIICMEGSKKNHGPHAGMLFVYLFVGERAPSPRSAARNALSLFACPTPAEISKSKAERSPPLSLAARYFVRCVRWELGDSVGVRVCRWEKPKRRI